MEPSVCFLLLSAKILKTSEGGANIDFLGRKIYFFTPLTGEKSLFIRYAEFYLFMSLSYNTLSATRNSP
jgi:hypothetical protein